MTKSDQSLTGAVLSSAMAGQDPEKEGKAIAKEYRRYVSAMYGRGETPLPMVQWMLNRRQETAAKSAGPIRTVSGNIPDYPATPGKIFISVGSHAKEKAAQTRARKAIKDGEKGVFINHKPESYLYGERWFVMVERDR